MQDLQARILKLKEDVQRTETRAASAEASVQFGRQQLAQIDEALVKLGVTPDNAEQDLAQLEAQLVKATDDLDAHLLAVNVELDRILALAREAGVTA